jgi:S1-C subfamily serine protease
VYKKLAAQFNQLAMGGKIRTTLSPLEIAAQAVWVLENDGASQGSAFFLKDVGIVSCEHCVGVNPHIYHHSDHSKKFPLKLRAKDNHRDLAVFDVPAELKNVHPIPLHNGTVLVSGAKITLLGYPNHFAARPVRIENGALIRTFPRSGVENIEITAKIIEGNSGGPVLNEKYEVIGIANRGISGSTKLHSAEFLAVHVDELAKLKI